MVKEGMKTLKHRKDPADVYDYTSTICEQGKYFIYDFPPPEMNKGCLVFIQHWEEELEKAFIHRENNDEVENKL